ncbi:MAG TPA: Ig-like domain-containing protein [Thermoanaerobaculia bacterium]|nr:Ig-like domain-containing protein [Thermoanaerobaculia bacterium]
MRSRRIALGAAALLTALAAACAPKPASIDISPKKVKIYGIERFQRLAAKVLDKKGQPLEPATPTWSASNDVVAAEAGGRIVAKKPGKSMVTATYEGVTAQVPVEVIDVAAVEITPPALALTGPAGTSVPISFSVKDSKQKVLDLKPTWSSSNPKVATISEDGLVTSVAAGTTTVVGKIGDIQGGCDVTVALKPIERVDIRPVTALARVGETQHFEVTAYGSDGLPIPEVAAVFKTSDPSVATVDGAGVATGKKPGAAKIRVELAGKSAEATLLVN